MARRGAPAGVRPPAGNDATDLEDFARRAQNAAQRNGRAMSGGVKGRPLSNAQVESARKNQRNIGKTKAGNGSKAVSKARREQIRGLKESGLMK